MLEDEFINLYHTGFIVCLCLMILFIGISIILFFVFRIRDVFDFMTGRGQKRTIRMMEEANARTGKLQEDYIPNTSSDLQRTPSGSIPAVSYPVTQPTDTGREPTAKIPRQVSAEEKTYAPTAAPSEGSEETELLMDMGSEETQLLMDMGAEETQLLKDAGNEETQLLDHGGNEETQLLDSTVAERAEAAADPGYGETVVLSSCQSDDAAGKGRFPGQFIIIKDTMLIHTDELI